MVRRQTPKLLWDFCALYTTDLRNRLVRPLQQLHGRIPYEVLTGNTPNISEFIEYEWYQSVLYYEPSAFPEQCKYLARWIGIAHRVGQAMCYWLLPASGIPIGRTTIQAIKAAELQETSTIQLTQTYDQTIQDKLQKLTNDVNNPMILSLYREDEDLEEEEDAPIELPSIPIEENTHDEMLLMEPLLMTSANGRVKAKVISRKCDQDGQLVGNYNNNPILNTRVYLAEFPDGTVAE